MKFLPLIILTFCIAPLLANAQPAEKIHYLKKTTHTSVNPTENTFLQTVNCKGICPAQQKEWISIYCGELDQLTNFKANYINKKGKRKSIKKKQFNKSTALTQSFYSGIEKTTFFFAAQDRAFPFTYRYQKKTKDLMFLSSIALYDHLTTDTFHFEILVPTGYTLAYRLDSLSAKVFATKQVQEPRATRYLFSSNAQQRKGVSQQDLPKIRMMVHKSDQAPTDFFNDWYFNLVKPHSSLQEESLQEILTHIPQTAAPMETIAAIFNFVKEKITYIDFENGIGAVQPRDVNQVLQHKQGDCKDMSNLLCQALKYFGFEAYIAISATLSHPYDFDFPSLASANHAICVVKLGEDWLFLDATEDYGIFGLPSRQIQDKHVFLVNEDQGQVLKVDKVTAAKNAVFHRLQLQQEGQILTGEGQYEYHGLSQIDLQFLQHYTSESKVHRYLSKSFEQKFSNTELSSFQLLNSDSTTAINYQCEINKMFTQIGQRVYLSLDFLPKPHQLPTKIAEDETFVTYESQHRALHLTLTLDKVVQLKPFEKINFEAEGLRFQMDIQQSEATKIEVYYLYENEHVQLAPHLVKSYNQLNQLIQESLQKSIIYESMP
ncbi:MAG: transglutaminase family protein [Saprospiraceae bacterium]